MYIHELMRDYGVKNLIRVGTAGARKEEVKVRDVVIAQSATTDSFQNTILFGNVSYAPTSNFELLLSSYNEAQKRGLDVKVGNVYTADSFYDSKTDTKQLADYGVLAVEMESAALFTIAEEYKARALAILTISDHLITGEVTSAEERQTTFNEIIHLVLFDRVPDRRT